MKLRNTILACSMSVLLAACGGASTPDSASVWQSQTTDNFGFPWKSIVVVGNDGTVNSSSPSSLVFYSGMMDKYLSTGETYFSAF